MKDLEKLEKLYFDCMSANVEGRRKCLNETSDVYYKVRLNARLLTIFKVENDEFEQFYFETPRLSVFTYNTNVPRLLKWIGISPEHIEGLMLWSTMTEEEQFDYFVSRRERLKTIFD
jgi:hypothetical protein